MAALVAAAKKEGTLNVIGLPPLWAGYGAIEKAFTRRYGITIRSVAPGATSQQQIAAVRRGHGSAGSPDVLDLATAQALAGTPLFAPYKVATWAAIPADQKAADGAWADDYGGYMSVGYDAARFGTITSLRELLGRRFARAVALDGNPAQAGAALYGVMMASLALGGAAGQHRAWRGFLPRTAGSRKLRPRLRDHPADDRVGQHAGRVQLGLPERPAVRRPVRAPLEGLHTGRPARSASLTRRRSARTRRTRRPRGCGRSSCTPRARSGGQNLWLLGGVRPVEQAAMIANHTIIAAASRPLPPPPAHPVFLTPAPGRPRGRLPAQALAPRLAAPWLAAPWLAAPWLAAPWLATTRASYRLAAGTGSSGMPHVAFGLDHGSRCDRPDSAPAGSPGGVLDGRRCRRPSSGWRG